MAMIKPVNATIDKLVQSDVTLSEDAQTMLKRFVEVMGRRGCIVPAADRKFAGFMLNAWASHKPLDKPTAIAAPCGFGKSTLVEIFVKHMYEKDPLTFGCVIVRNKREEVVQVAREINEAVGEKIAYPYLGYDDKTMTREEYIKQKEEQQNYPVLVMTHRMFALYASAEKLEFFSTFINEEGNKARRVNLFLDERPDIVVTAVFDPEKLQKFVNLLRAVAKTPTGQQRRYMKKVTEMAGKLYGIMNRYRTKKEFRMYVRPIARYYNPSDTMRADWAANYDGPEYYLLDLFVRAVRHGGYLYVDKNGKVTLTISYRLASQWTQFRPFILDATCDIDVHYKGTDLYIVKFPEDPDAYRTLTFHLWDGRNFSQEFFEKDPKNLDRSVVMVRDIVRNHRKTLVVVYKGYREYFVEKLADEIKAGRVKLSHFGESDRGTNEYRNCDAAIFLGWLFKGTHHVAVARALHDKEFSQESRRTPFGPRYKDARVEEVRFKEMVVERIQAIHRTRPRYAKHNINVYMFHRDREMLDAVTSRFPGATVLTFEPDAFSKRKAPTDELIVEYFAAWSPGTKKTAKEIYTELGMKRQQFGRSVNKDSVKKRLEELGIERRKEGKDTVFEKKGADGPSVMVAEDGTVLAQNAAGEWVPL